MKKNAFFLEVMAGLKKKKERKEEGREIGKKGHLESR